MKIDEIMYEKCDFFKKISERYDIPMSQVLVSYEKLLCSHINSEIYMAAFPDQKDFIEYVDTIFEQYSEDYDNKRERIYCLDCKQERKIKSENRLSYNGEVITLERQMFLSCGHRISVKISNTF